MTRRLDHDTAVAATLAEHGYGRQNLIDADDDHHVGAPVAVTTPSGSGSGSEMRRVSSPSMTLPGFGTGPVSTGGYARQDHNASYLADSLGQTYNPYTDNQRPHYDANQGLTGSTEMSRYSLPSGSGVTRPFFSHDPKDSQGSSEPLLGPTFGSETPPEPGTPNIPPRNPLRLVGGAGSSRHGDDGDDHEYEALRKQSLKVRPGVIDPTHPFDRLSSILGSKQRGLISSRSTSNEMTHKMLESLSTIAQPFSFLSALSRPYSPIWMIDA